MNQPPSVDAPAPDHAAKPDATVGQGDAASAAPGDARDLGRSDSARLDGAPTGPDAISDTRKADSIGDSAETGSSKPDMGKPEVSAPIDAGTFVSGIQVFTYKDYGPAESICLESTTAWLTAVEGSLGETRKCSAATDCMYVSFANSCGQICPVPINVQRTGEFYNQAVASFNAGCSECPTPESYPSCSAPPGGGEVTCRNSICDWK